MKQWVNLHQHTTYSFLDGHADPRKLLERAKELGQPAASQTDHGVIHGWMDFYEAAKDVGIKPILGMESYQARKTRWDKDPEERAGKAIDELEQRGPYHLTVLARNNAGYKNLIKLSSDAFLEGYYVKARIDHELLSDYSDGLIILSGCLNGEISQALLRGDYPFALKTAQAFQDIVGKENFYIEVMDHGLDEQHEVTPQLLEIAKTINAPIVPTADCHYVDKEDAHAHDVMLCISTSARIDDEKRFRFYNNEFYLKSYEEMEALFPPEWLKNTVDIADRVEVDLKFGEIYFPSFPNIPEGHDEDSYLHEQVKIGLAKRYGEVLPQEVKDRANYEFDVVQRMGFQSYFLVVWDLVRWAKEQGIMVGWGRGSAAGAILAYALGITDLDPLRFKLLFERFLVEGRKSMPDIDLDIDDRYRDRVINYARETYGEDRVSHICTFSRLQAKAAIKDSAAALGYSYEESNRVSKLVPPPVLGVSKSLTECMELDEFRKAYNSDKTVKDVVDTALQLEGIFRQTGIHAAGVVIAQGPIKNFIPVMRKNLKDGSPGPIVTQWDMHHVELNGQLKIDFLGLRNLSVMDMCVEIIEEVLDGLNIDVKDIATDDQATYADLAAGNTIGVFQLESPGMRQMTVSIKPNCIEDIMTIITLYRPGPMGSKMDQTYIARRNGRERVEYYHPKFEDLLSETYGVMLYQEDVLKVAKEIAGFTTGEADDLRKVIGKKLMAEIPLYRGKFVEGCKSHSGLSEHVANKIYSDIEYFGGYGFGRAHAASYAMLSYVTAYLKVHYPAEYMAALLTSVANKPQRMTAYLNECRRMGITITPPSIHKSDEEFKVLSNTEILFGLRSIRGVGKALAPRLMTGDRDYDNIYDFFRRSDVECLSKASLEALTYSGALDYLAPSQPSESLERDTRLEYIGLERARLGSYIIEHPLWSIRHIFQDAVDETIIDIQDANLGSFTKIGGIVTEVNKITTRRGDIMYRLFIEDLTASIEIIVFPREARKLARYMEEGMNIIVSGKVHHDGNDEEDDTVIVKLIASDIQELNVPSYGVGEPIIIRFADGIDYSIIGTIEQIIDDYPGDSPVLIEALEGKHSLVYRFKKPTSLDAKERIETLVTMSQGVSSASA